MSITDELSRTAVNAVVPARLEEESPKPPQTYGWLLQEAQPSWAHQVAKRGLDICGALVGLAMLALLLPIIALLIWWEDRGPIFYRQTLVGRHQQPFFAYKFRSMMVDADGYLARHPELLEAWRKRGKLRNDPRATRIGRLLRHTSLDELPQMLSVLRGEMSLVGPRVIQFSEIPAFGELIELRQTVKPGLTGLWQVSGRSMTNYEQRCILDCTYVLEHSFCIDMRILVKTLPVVIRGVGAY
jgi:lipopolysaccharide/colanic/teichoic acid biosynthesis glycosyltransferase